MSMNSPRRPGGGRDRTFEPPRPARPDRAFRQIRNGLVGIAVLVVAAAVGVVIVVYQRQPVSARPVHRGIALPPCRGSAPPPLQVFNYHGLCIGLTDGSYVFNPRLGPIERAIARENARVVKYPNYATVALLTPMTASPASDVSLSRIENELAGAYAAQLAYNGNLSKAAPPIQLVLANEGTSLEQGWQQVTTRLAAKAMTGPPVNLRVVIGMGISVEQTYSGAEILENAGIPMVGSVTTADQLDWSHIKGLARVVPDVGRQVATLQRYYAARGGLGPAFLVTDTDTDPSDLYTKDLKSDFTADFSHYLSSQPEEYGPGRGETTDFRIISNTLCPQGSSTPPTVLYAGREAALPSFVSNLQMDCGGKSITVVTGSDGVALPPSQTTNRPRQGHVSVVFTDIENPRLAAVLPDVRSVFAKSQAGAASLADPWTIASYNAMMAASVAVSDAADSDPNATPALSTVLSVIPDLRAVPGATGPFSIGSTGNVIHPDIPIVELRNGSMHILSR
jgi:hypothetical protein